MTDLAHNNSNINNYSNTSDSMVTRILDMNDVFIPKVNFNELCKVSKKNKTSFCYPYSDKIKRYMLTDKNINENNIRKNRPFYKFKISGFIQNLTP